MTDRPFSILEPFADRFTVRFFTKKHNLRTDEDLKPLLGSDAIASLWQSHGDRTVILREPGSRTEKADAIATDAPNLWITIRAADCQQLVVYAPGRHVAAVIHAGWKGLKAGIIQSLYKTLNDEWGIGPEETFVAIGPSLCTQCAEFTDPLTELAGLDPHFFHGRNADLQGIADMQLDELGVPGANRERSADCTKCSPETYWTYRGGDRENVQAGHTNVIACMLA